MANITKLDRLNHNVCGLLIAVVLQLWLVIMLVGSIRDQHKRAIELQEINNKLLKEQGEQLDRVQKEYADILQQQKLLQNWITGEN